MYTMKIKRILFIASLIVLFGVCFTIMNKHYDELARYPYVNDENREIILEYLSTEDINYMIAQQIKPETFLPFIQEKGFQIRNCVWYSRTKQLQDASNETIVAFVNEFRTKIDYANLATLLDAYSYQTLRTFFESANEYIKNATITQNPSNILTVLHNEDSLYSYEPKDLVSVSELPSVSMVDDVTEIKVREEVVEPLHNLCKGLSEVNDKTCGNLILTAGYISYEQQIPLYERMMLKYGKDEFQKYWDYPGQSEYQLGYSVRFQLAGKENSAIDEFTTSPAKEDKENTTNTTENPEVKEEEALILWLEENAYKYGFVIRYPKDKEKVTGKNHQPFTLRYVGEEVAKQLHEDGKTVNEYSISAK